jgi:sugar-specific transcriptional regulator TrmB
MPREMSAYQHLVDLGLNDLEAEVYLALLASKPITAYGIARQIGKATANTYKAVESLARRGAVLIEDGDHRLCRAVPVREFMAHLQNSFADRARAAEERLSRIQLETHDERVYKMESIGQLLERCRQMIVERAERIVTVDAFPNALSRIAGHLESAAARNVEVQVLAYAPVEIPGVKIAVAPRGREAAEYWNSQQLNVVVDGREALLALLDTEISRIHQAHWSNSLYLSCLVHAGITSEQTIHRLFEARAQKASRAELDEILDRHRFFLNSEVPGQKELVARFVAAAE